MGNFLVFLVDKEYIFLINILSHKKNPIQTKIN